MIKKINESKSTDIEPILNAIDYIIDNAELEWRDIDSKYVEDVPSKHAKIKKYCENLVFSPLDEINHQMAERIQDELAHSYGTFFDMLFEGSGDDMFAEVYFRKENYITRVVLTFAQNYDLPGSYKIVNYSIDVKDNNVDEIHSASEFV